MADQVVTYRPNSTINNPGWTLNGGATVHGILSDDSDASYLSATVIYSQCYITFGATAGRAFSDGVTTNASATVTSATAAFVASDVGRAFSGTNIPAGALVRTVVNATTITLTVPATGTGSSLTLTLGAFTFPSNAIIRSIKLRVRASVTGTPGTDGVLGFDDVNYGAADSLQAAGPFTTSFATYPAGTNVYPPSDVGHSYWQASDIANLHIYLQAYLNTATAVRVAEAYLDIAWDWPPDSPVVTTPVTVTTQTPAFAYTYSDPESDALSKSYFIIYSAAQYGAAGFIAPTSTVGVVIGTGAGQAYAAVATNGSTPTVNVTVALPAGAYRGYLFVADAIYPMETGTSQDSHWSVVPSIINFTVSIDLPAAPTVTSVTPDPTLNRVALVVQGADNELTRNQGSAESGVSGWTGVTNVAATYPQRDTVRFLDGGAAVKGRSAAAGTVTLRSTTGVTLAILQREAVAVLPTKQYTALASISGGTAARTATVQIDWYTAAAAFISSSASGAITVPTGASTFTQGSITVTSPGTAAFAVITLSYLGAVAATEDFWWDQIGIAPGASTTWTRGGFVGLQGTMSDTFTRADSAVTLGNSEGSQTPAWVAQSGTWGIQSNRAYSPTPTAGAMTSAALPGVTLVDGVFTCDITLSTVRAAAGLMVRTIDNANMIYILINDAGGNNTLSISKLVASSGTILASINTLGFVNGRTYGLKVELFGALINTYIDRKDGAGWVFALSATLDATALGQFAAATANRAGLFLLYDASSAAYDDAGTRFDNFVATPAPSQRLIVERSVDGGTTWLTSRSVNRADLTDPGQTATVYDYEAPRATAVRYRAKIVATEGLLTLTGPVSGTTLMSPNLAGDGNAWLKSPTDPTKNMVVPLTAGMVSDSAEDLAVYEPLGRADPIIHGGTIRTEEFEQLDFMFASDATWDAFEVLRRRQEPLLLQTCYGDTALDEYWVRLGPKRRVQRFTTDDMATATKRRVSIPAREVGVPVVV